MATWTLYHDQGLIPVKVALAFDAAVNTSPGALPLLAHLQPDHGTGFSTSLAWGSPESMSMRAALETAWEAGFLKRALFSLV